VIALRDGRFQRVTRRSSPALMALPPLLGGYDATAHTVMTYVFGASIVSSWERDAVANGYTMAFARIYVDDTGQ
jgi:hypothetical protein